MGVDNVDTQGTQAAATQAFVTSSEAGIEIIEARGHQSADSQALTAPSGTGIDNVDTCVGKGQSDE